MVGRREVEGRGWPRGAPGCRGYEGAMGKAILLFYSGGRGSGASRQGLVWRRCEIMMFLLMKVRG